MSCFQGRMREYTSVSLDRFDGKNVSSTVFFLSHCHRDHMVGLELSAFHQRLRSRTDVFLYCSAVTRTLLLADTQYRPLDKYIKVLSVNTPTTLTVPDKGCDVRKTYSVLVTALSAGHCPGSVMFLFEGKEGTVLYTGDFRWETNYAQSLQVFKSGNSVKEIKSLYIDTTFCFEDAFHFPSRTDCVEAASELVRKWLRQSDDHVVSISCKAKYGYEHFLQEMFAKTGEKIHISPHKYGVYQQIGELSQVFTTDPSAKIHACDFRPERSSLSRLPCGYLPADRRDLRVLVLRPSTMFFALQRPQYRQNDLVVYPKGPRGLHRVCYSFHSSYVEVRDLVMFLRPQRVFPNVRPPNEGDMSKVQGRLNGFLRLVHLNHVPSHVAPGNVLGKLKVRRRVNQVPQWSQSDSEDLVFDSTPVKSTPLDARQDLVFDSSPVKDKDTRQETPTKEPCVWDSQSSVTGATPAKSDISAADSSYQASLIDNEEMDLTKSPEDGQGDTGPPDPPLSTQDLLASQDGGGDTVLPNDNTQDSYCLYVSGDEDCEEEDRFSTFLYPDNDDIVLTESSLSQDSIGINQEVTVGTPEKHELEIISIKSPDKGDSVAACDGAAESEVRDAGLSVIELSSHAGKGRNLGESEEKTNPAETSNDHTKALSVKDTATVLTCDVNQCNISGDKSDGSSAQKNRDTSDKSEGSTETRVSDSKDTDLISTKDVGDLSSVDCVVMQDNSGLSCKLSKSTTIETDSVSSSSQISSPVASTAQKGRARFHKTGSFDLFDEGNVTDIEDNVTEDTRDSQGFDVELSSDSGVDSRARRRKYITEIDKEQEMNLRQATAQMLLRLQKGHVQVASVPPPPGEQIVISDSDSDTESGFLSGSKDCAAKPPPSDQSKYVVRKDSCHSSNLSALVSKVEKRLASSDSEFSPRKRLRLDISRNCESDSDVTLPPSQGSYGSRLHTSLYYDSTDSSESDTDSDAVEILYETDPSGAKFDVLGNPLKSEASVVTVCVKQVDQSPGDHTTTEGSVIDLTTDNEEELEKK